VSPFSPETADEYVLGLLDEEEARRIERLAETNEGVARAIAQSRDRFVELDLQTAPLTMPGGLSTRILAELTSIDQRVDTVPVRSAASGKSMVRRTVLPAAAAAMLALAVGLGIGWQAGSADPRVIAVLLDDAGVPRAMVEDFGDDTARLRFLTAVEVPDDRVMQVWTLPSADMGPRSMGLLPDARVTRLDDFNLPPPAEDQLYEITLEPEGGSPTGLPTGPILAKGFGAFQTY
jgi:anti-sigma-K factor RskA